MSTGGTGAEEIEKFVVTFQVEGGNYEADLEKKSNATKNAAFAAAYSVEMAAKRIADQWKFQAETFGMTSRAAELYRMKAVGVSEAILQQATATDKLLTSLEGEKRATEDSVRLQNAVNKLTNDLFAETQAFGQSSSAVELYRLRIRGATDAQLAAAEANLKNLNALKKQRDSQLAVANSIEQLKQKHQQLLLGANTYALYQMAANGASNSEIKFAWSLQRAIASEEHKIELQKRALQITQQYESKQITFNRTFEELNRLLKINLISLEVYNAALLDASSKLPNLASKMSSVFNPLNNQTVQAGRAITSFGRQISFGVTLPLVGMGVASTREFGKLNKNLTRAEAIMGNVTDSMKSKLRSTISDLTKAGSVFSPDELARGIHVLIAAGQTGEQAIKGLDVVTNFATAGTFSLDRATQLLMDSQAALGKMEKDAIKNRQNMIQVSNALVKAADQSTGSVEQFAEALANGAADATQFGMSMETIMAVLDAYSTKGNKGASAGSDLARATRLLSRAALENKAVFEQMGIKVTDNAGRYRNFIDIIADMEKAFKHLTPEQRTANLLTLGFEALAQTAIRPLLGMSEAMKQWEAEQKKAINSNYTEKIANKQKEAFSNQMLATWNKIKLMATEIGEILAPYFTKMGKMLEVLISGWDMLPRSMKEFLVVGAAITATIGPMVVAGGMLTTTYGFLANASMVLTGATLAQNSAMGSSALLMGVGTKLAAGLGIAVAALGGYYAGTAIRVWFCGDSYEYLNREMEKSAKLNLELNTRFTKQTSAIAETALGIKDAAKQQEFLNKEIAIAEKELAGYELGLRQVEQVIEEMKTRAGTMGWLFGNKEVQVEEANLKDMAAKADAMQNRIKALQELKINNAKFGDFADVDSVTSLDVAIRELEEDLQRQVNTFGKSKEEVALYDLEVKKATPTQLEHARSLIATLKAQEELDKARRESAKFEDDIMRLESEVATFGKGERAAKIYEMRLRGIDQALIDMASSHDATLTALEQQKKMMEEVQAVQVKRDKLQAEVDMFGKTEAAIKLYQLSLSGANEETLKQTKAIYEQMDALEQQKNKMEKAAKLTEEFQDPRIKYKKEKEHLDQLLKDKLIGVDIHKKAIDKLNDDLAKDHKLHYIVTFSFKSLDFEYNKNSDRARDFINSIQDSTMEPMKKLTKAEILKMKGAANKAKLDALKKNKKNKKDTEPILVGVPEEMKIPEFGAWGSKRDEFPKMVPSEFPNNLPITPYTEHGNGSRHQPMETPVVSATTNSNPTSVLEALQIIAKNTNPDKSVRIKPADFGG